MKIRIHKIFITDVDLFMVTKFMIVDIDLFMYRCRFINVVQYMQSL